MANDDVIERTANDALAEAGGYTGQCKCRRTDAPCYVCELVLRLCDSLRASRARVAELREHMTVIAECENLTYCDLCRSRAKAAMAGEADS